jgi:hypothetical protein
MYGMNRYIGCGGDDSRGCVGRGEVCDICQDFLPVGKNPPPPSLLGDFGREFGVRAPGFDGAAKLRKNADRATLLHITIIHVHRNIRIRSYILLLDSDSRMVCRDRCALTPNNC